MLAAGAFAFGSWTVGPEAAASGAPLSTGAAPVVAPLATTSYADAVEKALPAVVTVRVEREAPMPAQFDFPDDPIFRRFFGEPAPNQRRGPAPLQRGLGSGVIMTADGTIVTNNHVVDGAERVRVVLDDGREFTAKVLGTDPATDLAVIDVDATDLPTLPVAESDRVRVGDVVLAVGNPLGIGQTVTMGIVSATGRTTNLGGEGAYEDFIQTDAPINRGNSGGALITTAGELVGINSQIMSPSGGNIGIGFAIPTKMVDNVMTQLVEHGRVRRGMLGVTIQPVTADLANGLGLDRIGGAIVSSVESGSPAEKANIEVGDVILGVNGQAVDDSNDLRNRISAAAPGTSVTLDVVRDGDRRRVEATLAEMPGTRQAREGRSSEHGELGMSLESITPSLANRLQLPRSTTGVVVTGTDPAGAAARAGLRAGDVIREVDGEGVRTPDAVREAMAARGDRPAVLLVERDGQSVFVAVR
jgi:Do/DeqQ family serine protease